jgi:hypothetical protein
MIPPNRGRRSLLRTDRIRQHRRANPRVRPYRKMVSGHSPERMTSARPAARHRRRPSEWRGTSRPHTGRLGLRPDDPRQPILNPEFPRLQRIARAPQAGSPPRAARACAPPPTCGVWPAPRYECLLPRRRGTVTRVTTLVSASRHLIEAPSGDDADDVCARSHRARAACPMLAAWTSQRGSILRTDGRGWLRAPSPPSWLPGGFSWAR